MDLSADAPTAVEPVPAKTRRRAARGGSILVAIAIAQRLLPFALLPVYAAVLSPAEYGVVAFLLAATGFVSALLALGLEPAVLRTFVRLGDAPREREVFVNTLGLFGLTLPLVGSVAAAAGLVAVGGAPTSAMSHLVVVPMAFIAAAFQTTSSVFVGAVLRAKENYLRYAILTLAQVLGTQALLLLLVVGMGLGLTGWFLGTLVGSAVTLVAGLMSIEHRWSSAFSLRHLVPAIRFGLPLLPHSLSHWALNLSDRLVLTAFVATSVVGIYNVAYQLAAPIGLILIAIRQALMPMYAQAGDDERIRHDLADVATMQVHAAGFLGLAAALLAPEFVHLAFPGAYAEAAELIPWIALGFVFFGIYLIPVDSLSLMLGRTTWIWVPTSVAASANVALNLVLVPVLGPLAAAINTALAYGLLFCGVVLLRRRTAGVRLEYDLPKMAVGLLIVGAGACVNFVVVTTVHAISSLAVRVVIVGVVAILLVLLNASWLQTRRTPLGSRRRMSGPQDQPDQGLPRSSHV